MLAKKVNATIPDAISPRCMDVVRVVLRVIVLHQKGRPLDNEESVRCAEHVRSWGGITVCTSAVGAVPESYLVWRRLPALSRCICLLGRST